MAVTFVPYIIVLDDAAQVAALNAAPSRWNRPRNDAAGSLVIQSIDDGATVQGGNGKLFCSPNRALAEFPGCTIQKMGSGVPVTSMPYLWSMWIWDDNSATYPLDKDTWVAFNRWRFTRYIWVATFVYGGAGTVTDSDDTYQQLRWFNGFDDADSGPTGTVASHDYCPEASRHLGGLGLMCSELLTARYQEMAIGTLRGASFKPTASWERLYIRVRTRPSAVSYFWEVTNSGGSFTSLVLGVTPTGQIAIYHRTGVGTFALLGTSAALDTGARASWYKLDLIASIAGTSRLFINGVEELSIGALGTGWGATVDGFLQPTYHAISRVGHIITTASSNGGTFHFDDWSNHDAPVMFDQQDFLAGTRVIRLHPTALGAAHVGAAWGTNPVERLDSVPPDGLPTGSEFTSSTASSAMSVDTDVNERTNTDPRRAEGGILAALAWVNVKAASGAATGEIGYSKNGGAFTNTAIAETTSFLYYRTAYLPSGLTAPEVVESLEVKYTPGASAHLRTVRNIGASVLICGRFGAEDVPVEERETGAPPNIPPDVGQQNFAYPRSPWSDYQSFPPMAPIQIIGGTYLGNDTINRLTFEYPVTFFFVRRVDATSAQGALYWPSMLSPTEGAQREPSTEGGVKFEYNLADPPPALDSGDPLGEVTITIIGNSARANASGVTYQYIAFCDPGGRFSHIGSVHHSAGTANRTTTLYRGNARMTDWETSFGFFQKMVLGASVSNGLVVKGPSPGVAVMGVTSTSVIAAGADFSVDGEITTQSGLHYGSDAAYLALAFALFRKQDWSDDDGSKVLQIFSYTGDGGSSRTIQLSPTGQRPLFAFVVPTNAQCFFRDPSHTGTTSSQYTTGGALTANASTGITGGGIDQLNVGSALNGNGITYDVFVIMGGSCSGNNGFSCNDTFEPIEPVLPPCVDDDGEEIECPCEGNTEPEAEDDCGDCEDCECADEECGCVGEECECEGDDCDDDCDPDVEDCDDDGGGPDLEECPAASQKIVNQALSHIGVTNFIRDINADETPQASLARLHYDDAVRTVLEAFPWLFATKYADLELIDGAEDDPVNGDWTYSYRLPDDCVTARRLVDEAIKRAPTATPIEFRVGSDDDGDLLYTDRSEADGVQLEYTARPDCSATKGSQTFREALTWFVASKLAPSLARNNRTAEDCLRAYDHFLRVAQVEDKNEQRGDNSGGDAPWITGR